VQNIIIRSPFILHTISEREVVFRSMYLSSSSNFKLYKMKCFIISVIFSSFLIIHNSFCEENEINADDNTDEHETVNFAHEGKKIFPLYLFTSFLSFSEFI
jgi:hypothetical protein